MGLTLGPVLVNIIITGKDKHGTKPDQPMYQHLTNYNALTMHFLI